jgi:hypothetical protein
MIGLSSDDSQSIVQSLEGRQHPATDARVPFVWETVRLGGLQ